MIEAKENYGLTGLMESHHYGLTPSFISDLTKESYLFPNTSMEESLIRILKKHFGEENLEFVNDALSKWSEAIRYLTPSIEEQCGACRIGPAFPFSLITPIKTPSSDYAIFGNAIVDGIYPEVYLGKESLPFLRIKDEIESLKKMAKLIEEGINIILKTQNRNDELERLINLGQFIGCMSKTILYSKSWHFIKMKIKTQESKEEILKLTVQLREIAVLERENALSAIEFVNKDSRLGWEPSMEYMCDEAHIRWKLKHLDYVVNYEIPNFEMGAKL